jgi:hypothetical protein
VTLPKKARIMVYLQDDLLLYRNFEKTHRHGRQVILAMYEVRRCEGLRLMFVSPPCAVQKRSWVVGGRMIDWWQSVLKGRFDKMYK